MQCRADFEYLNENFGISEQKAIPKGIKMTFSPKGPLAVKFPENGI